MTTTSTSSSSQELIGFGSDYYHALGGTERVELHHFSEEDELLVEDEQETIVHAHVLKDPPWTDDTVLQVVCSATSTIFVTQQGHVYQTGTFYGRQWTSPTRVEICFPRKCVEVSAGRHFCIGRLERGIGVVSWGAGHFGQLGLGPNVLGAARPQMIPHLLPQALGTTRVQQVAAGAWHALALLDNGHVMAWGSNRKYQCGIKQGGKTNAPPTITVPQRMEFYGSFSKVACGKLHSVGLERDTGRVYTWGASHFGQCGQYSRKTCIAPPRLVEALQRVAVVDISAGDAHSLALTGGGRVFVWGSGMDGQLGLGGVVPISRPKLLADLDFVAIEAGREWKQQQIESSSSTEVKDGRPYTASPILGSSPFQDLPEALPSVPHLSAVPKIVKIEAGGSYSVAISSSGHAYVWGYNDVGQLGLPPCSQLPLVEMTSTTMKQSSSGRLLQIKSFESRHNVLLPRRVDALADYDISQVATGPCHLWCMGTKRSEEEQDVIVGRTLYEAQEERRRRSMLRLRRHLSSPASSLVRSPPPAIVSSPIREEDDSPATLESQPMDTGAIVAPIPGEYQSLTQAPRIQETPPLESKMPATPDSTTRKSLSSNGSKSPFMTPKTKQIDGAVAPSSAPARAVGRSKSLSRLIGRRSNSQKRASQKDTPRSQSQKRATEKEAAQSQKRVPEKEAARSQSQKRASENAAPYQKLTDDWEPPAAPGSPPSSPTTSSSSIKRGADRSSSVPAIGTSPQSDDLETLPSPSCAPRLGSSRSVSRLMLGRRNPRSPKTDEKPKRGRVRKALNSAFGK